MGTRTIPGGMLEYMRTSAPLQYVDLNSGGPSNAAPAADEVRVIELVEIGCTGLTGECAQVWLRLTGASTYQSHVWTCNAVVNVTAVAATNTTGSYADCEPRLWEPGHTAAITVTGTFVDYARICYRSIPLSVAINQFGYIPSVDTGL